MMSEGLSAQVSVVEEKEKSLVELKRKIKTHLATHFHEITFNDIFSAEIEFANVPEMLFSDVPAVEFTLKTTKGKNNRFTAIIRDNEVVRVLHNETSEYQRENKLKPSRRQVLMTLFATGTALSLSDMLGWFGRSKAQEEQEDNLDTAEEELIPPESVVTIGDQVIDAQAAFLRRPELITRDPIHQLITHFVPDYESRFEITKDEAVRRFREWVKVSVKGLDRLLVLKVNNLVDPAWTLLYGPVLAAIQMANCAYRAPIDSVSVESLVSNGEAANGVLYRTLVESLLYTHGSTLERFQQLSDAFDPEAFTLQVDQEVNVSTETKTVSTNKDWWAKILKALSPLGSSSIDKVTLQKGTGAATLPPETTGYREIFIGEQADHAGIIHETNHNHNDGGSYYYMQSARSNVIEHSLLMSIKFERLVSLLRSGSFFVNQELCAFFGIGHDEDNKIRAFKLLANRASLDGEVPYPEVGEQEVTLGDIFEAINHFFHLLVGPQQQFIDMPNEQRIVQTPFLGDNMFISSNQSSGNQGSISNIRMRYIDHLRVKETKRFNNLWALLTTGKLYNQGDNYALFKEVEKFLRPSSALFSNRNTLTELDETIAEGIKVNGESKVPITYSQLEMFIFRVSVAASTYEHFDVPESAASMHNELSSHYLENYQSATILTNELLLLHFLIESGRSETFDTVVEHVKAVIGNTQLTNAIKQMSEYWEYKIESMGEGFDLVVPYFEDNMLGLRKRYNSISLENLQQKLRVVRMYISNPLNNL